MIKLERAEFLGMHRKGKKDSRTSLLPRLVELWNLNSIFDSLKAIS